MWRLKLKYRNLWLLLIFILCFEALHGQIIDATLSAKVVSISGRLRERGTRKPLANINIYCFAPTDSATPLKAVTDAAGNFSLSVPEGPIRWRVSSASYDVFEQTEDVRGAVENITREFYLQKQSYLTYETTVFGQGEKRDDKTKSLTQDQFLTIPGANGDPVKAIQNLPGVNRGNSFSSQVIIEGSAPQDTQYTIDTQNVPIIFHFFGLSSVVTPEAVDHVDYLSAGFGPEFGSTTAGLINLYTKDPQTDRWHGFGYVDLFNAGGMTEGPLNDHSSLLIGVRKSYIGAVLGAAAKGNSNFNLTVAPDFNDTIIEYKNQLSAVDSFKMVGVGSIDTLGFLLSAPLEQDPAIRGSFSQNTTFFRLIPQYTHKYSSDTTGRFWMGIGQDSMKQNFGTFYYNGTSSVVSGRAEVETQLSPTWKSYFGFDTVSSWEDVSFQIPFTPGAQAGAMTPLGASAVQTVSSNYTTSNSGLYWRNTVHAEDSRWTYLPGLRLDYFKFTNEVIPQPRLAARLALDHGLTLRGATGLYSDIPPPQNFDSNYGNPSLKAQRAIHGSLGLEKDFKDGRSDGWIISSDVFYKHLYNLVQSTSDLTPSGQPRYYNNDGLGRVYGLELMTKYQSRGWSGWLAYTLSKSTRTYPPASEQIFQYDQTHNIILVADRELGRNWKFSGRFRYTTGNPYTPKIGGVLDVDNDVYIPFTGGAYSQRISDFYQLDVRFDKKWIYDTWIMTAYFDIQNLTNHANVQTINYSYNYQQQATVTGLPILPSFGLKGEF